MDCVHGFWDGAACACAPGFTGPLCELPRFAACAIGDDGYVPCESVRKFAPVACTCIAQCEASDTPVCGPGSNGCSFRWKKRVTFVADLPCLVNASDSRVPPGPGVLETTYGSRHDPRTYRLPALRVPHYSPRAVNVRAGGREQMVTDRLVDESVCDGCGRRGRCLASGRCACFDGHFGKHCEHQCDNNCANDCSGRGRCEHGWCRCERGWRGHDCSIGDGNITVVADLIGQDGVGPHLADVPARIAAKVRRLERRVYVYELPAHVIRGGTESYAPRYWGADAFDACDPVHKRRLYQIEAHIDAQLRLDRFVRTFDPREASLFYVPANLLPRLTWGSDPGPMVRRVLAYIRTAHPYWNRTGGADHVWTVFGEKMVCEFPKEVRDRSILISLWGGDVDYPRGVPSIDCVRRGKDIVVPPLTPLQHDRDRFEKSRPLFATLEQLRSNTRPTLLFFSGGIVSFGASQDHRRKHGHDTPDIRTKWNRRVDRDDCARPDGACRSVYSMGVRQAVWRARLYADPEIRIVSAGVGDYVEALQTSEFCLHTEGNSWGTRLVDYAMFGCVPLIVNDGMILPFDDLLDYPSFSVHAGKQQIPDLPRLLRARRNGTSAMRRTMYATRAALQWWRPQGRAYEFLLASLADRVPAAAQQTSERRLGGSVA